MTIEKIYSANDGNPIWFGYGDFEIYSPLRDVVLHLSYVSEPPFGDSYHKLTIAQHSLVGYIWGSRIVWSQNSYYFACDWTGANSRLERITLIVDAKNLTYFPLPEFISVQKFEYPTIFQKEFIQNVPVFTFTGTEDWINMTSI